MNKRIFIEPIVFILAFAATFFLPICIFYFSGDKGTMIEKPQYLYDIPTMYALFFFFGMFLTGMYSGNKNLLTIVAMISFSLTALLFFYMQTGFKMWSASPVHPTFGLGYWMSNAILVLFGIRAFQLRKMIEEKPFRKLISFSFYGATITIALILFASAFTVYNKQSTTPVLQEISMNYKNNQPISVQTWEYPSYNTSVVKYFRMPIDSLHEKEMVLDSIHVLVRDDKYNFVKEYSKVIKDPKFDLEKELEANAK